MASVRPWQRSRASTSGLYSYIPRPPFRSLIDISWLLLRAHARTVLHQGVTMGRAAITRTATEGAAPAPARDLALSSSRYDGHGAIYTRARNHSPVPARRRRSLPTGSRRDDASSQNISTAERPRKRRTLVGARDDGDRSRDTGSGLGSRRFSHSRPSQSPSPTSGRPGLSLGLSLSLSRHA
jgi:hypothetical protein